jgi:hypothetical protein
LIRSTRAIASPQLLGRVDHLVYATPDLKLGIHKLEKLLGVRATPGGQHLGLGTRNALIALGLGNSRESSAVAFTPLDVV